MSNHSKKARNFAALSGGALVVASPFVTSGTAQAATFTVDSLADDGSGGTTLREAIELADADPATADVITFAAGLSGTITLTEGALYVNSSVDIQGPGASALTITTDGDDHTVFYVYVNDAQADISISGLKVTGANTTDEGGAVTAYGEDVTLSNMVITGNTGDYAGGVYFGGKYDGDEATLTIRNSDISGNTGSSYAGGVYVQSGGSETAYSLVLVDSTVSGNSGANFGGGLYFSDQTVGRIAVLNSTISGNSADGGGGIYIEDSNVNILIANSTITGNSATTSYGGGLYLGDDTNSASIINSVISGNSAASGPDDLYGNGSTPVIIRYSLIGEMDGVSVVDGTGMVAGDPDPMLGALAANGGIGKTHLPQAGSPLIDAGDPAGIGISSYPATDQRGQARVYNGRIDIGAVEVGAATLPPTGGSNGLLAGLGAALLGLGGALHLTGRRKRSA